MVIDLAARDTYALEVCCLQGRSWKSSTSIPRVSCRLDPTKYSEAWPSVQRLIFDGLYRGPTRYEVLYNQEKIDSTGSNGNLGQNEPHWLSIDYRRPD